MTKNIITLIVTALICLSCNHKKGSKSTQKEEVKEIPKEISIVITSDDSMRFNKKELNVYEGQKVTLTFKHVGKMDKSVMGHNFVLLKQGVKLGSFAQKAMDAKETAYIPKGDFVIAHTKMLGGGESDTIVFNAPKKGTYNFICSFPGHYALMKGKFIVK